MNENDKNKGGMLTPSQLDALEINANIRFLNREEMRLLFNHVHALQDAVNNGFSLLNVIAGSNSQFAPRATDVVNQVLYGTTDKKVIEAAQRYLATSATFKAMGVKYTK